jgi:guanylate kinase
MNRRIIILTWVSWSGKTTIQNELLKLGWGRPLNFTTRKPRSVEALKNLDEDWDFTHSELSEYIFVDRKTFLNKYWNWDFIEQTNYWGNFYWVSKFLPEDKNVVIVLDPVWRNVVLEYFARRGIEIETYYIRISPELQDSRLFERGDDEEEVLKRKIDFKWFFPTNKCKILDWRKSIEELVSEIIKDEY